MKKLTIFLLLTFLISIQAAFSQDSAFIKHPKVIEVEMQLSKDATSFLQHRLPNEQVYVNVNIEPLRRSSDAKNEQLPYFASEDEVGDEWDVLETPVILLLSRIKHATMTVEVPNRITDAEISDLKEKLYEHLKLIPVRDTITFTRKSAPAPVVAEKDNTLYYFITGLSLLVFAGLFISLKFTNSKSTTTSASSTNSAGASSAPVASAPTMRSNNSKSSGSGTLSSVHSKVNGDINFNDSIKAADMLKEKLHGVINSQIFPLLSDMLILEELSQKSLNSLGAFIFELPRKQQQKVFFRGRSDKWFRGYIEATTVNMDCFMAVDKMVRNRNSSDSEKWEELLIQVWRLDDEAYLFLKQIPADEAFNILSYMPKSFSVPCAKKAFPGGWARILETRDSKPIEDQAKIEDYLNRTLQLKPYFSFKSIDDYKKDLELVDYLRNATLKDEEEVYESLSTTSSIHKIRPPFYAVFRADDESFKAVFAQYDLSEWAMAVLNAPRDYIKKVTNELDDKKKYIFSTYLKQLDENQPPAKEQNDLREDIAKSFQFISLQNAENSKLKNEDKVKNENENAQAA